MKEDGDESINNPKKFVKTNALKRNRNNVLGIISIILGFSIIIINTRNAVFDKNCYSSYADELLSFPLLIFDFIICVFGLSYDRSKRFAEIGFILLIIGGFMTMIVLYFVNAIYGSCLT